MMAIRNQRGGFTLIELLAGITVLTIMVLFLTKMFTESSAAWARGTARVESNLTGRSVVEFMSRELAGLITEGTLTLKLETDVTDAMGFLSDQIYFVTTDQHPRLSSGGNLYRQVKTVSYGMSNMRHPITGNVLSNRFRIMRAGMENFTSSAISDLYQNSNWWQDYNMSFNAVLAENVRALDFWIYDKDGSVQADYDSSVHGPPSRIDIVVEVLPDSDATRLALLDSDEARFDYADRVARRYFNTVYFNNYAGYALSK